MKKIAIVDDNSVNLKVLEHALIQKYDVIAFQESTKFLQEMANGRCPVDLVILDRMMPQLSGDDLLVFMKENYPDIPVIICSALSSEIDIEDSLQNGADEYITKPIIVEDLYNTLERFLN